MDIREAVEELVNGTLSARGYDKISDYLHHFLFTYKLPPHLDIDDIVSIAINNAYFARDSFDDTKSAPVTWFLTIARYAALVEIKSTARRIPTDKFIKNEISNDNSISSIFDILNIEDTDPLDVLRDPAEDVSNRLYRFILDTNLKVLEEFTYNNLSMQEIATKYGVTLATVKSRLMANRLTCLLHFTDKTQFDIIYKSKKKLKSKK